MARCEELLKQCLEQRAFEKNRANLREDSVSSKGSPDTSTATTADSVIAEEIHQRTRS